MANAQITVTADTAAVGTYDVYEITIGHPVSYANNWDDVIVNAVFTGPQTIKINGFYYDTNIWKVRFAPPLPGKWTYAITFTTPSGSYTAGGTLNAIPSATKGFLKRHPNDPFRLIFADGTLFNGIGIEDCILDDNTDGTPLNDWGLDGNFAPARSHGTRVGLDKYMNAYAVNGAGFNLYRWTTDNCSFRLYNSITETGNSYDVKAGMWGDTLVQTLRKNKMRIWMDFFGPPVFNNITGSTPLQEAAVKKYINYVVARYGAYADIWELFNENFASSYYINTVTAYIRSIDPYHRLISISAQQPQLPAIDIDSPHWYEKESELRSDLRTVDRLSVEKPYNKPVIFGEQGNAIANWDTLSAERMRIRSWTAFFAEGMFIFWNTTYIKNYYQPVSANIYLGPQERGYIRALQNYTATADSGIRPISFFVSNSHQVRSYGLKSSKIIMGYFHHYTSHTNYVTTSFTYRMHQPGTLYWLNPADNTVIDSAKLAYGTQKITSPQFNIDVAMLIVLSPNDLPFNTADKFDVLVYPNPVSNALYVDGNFNNTATIELYDMLGKKIMTETNVVNDHLINIQGVSKGIYVYRVTADERHATGKIIVK